MIPSNERYVLLLTGDVNIQVVVLATVWGGLQTAPTDLLPTLSQGWCILGASCDQSPNRCPSLIAHKNV